MKKRILMVLLVTIFSLTNASCVSLKEREFSAEKLLGQMTLEEKVYQLFFVTPEEITGLGNVISAGETTKKAIEEKPVGGIIYFSANFKDDEQTAEMIKNTQSFSKIPLFIGVDEEGGRVSRLGSNPKMKVTKHPDMLSVGKTGDTQKASEIGKTLGKELSMLGFNVDFAPICDIILTEKNTEIGDRSFGTDAKVVSDMVASIVPEMEKSGVSAVLKHFPGHGSTISDSHKGYSKTTRTKEEMQKAEFLPFISGIECGADFVMVSGLTAVNVTEDDCPASLSKEIVTDILINELGFEGIIITDSFSMGAITNEYSSGEACIKAIDAGIDMILMPVNLKEAHASIVDAVKKNIISEDRIDKSVLKILKLKGEKGLFKKGE